jgi:hypothetical protein
VNLINDDLIQENSEIINIAITNSSRLKKILKLFSACA